MNFSIKSLPEKACNFENLFHKQFEYSLIDLDGIPLPKDLLDQFNTVVMPKEYEKYFDAIRNLKVYDDDTWVITYPKCGTTWTQETVWQICNDVDIDGKGKERLERRFPFVEILSVAAAPKNENEFDFINQVDRPRYIKSHLPICFLPKQLWTAKPKIIYTMRDPKDTAISFYHHYYNLYKYQGSKEDYFDCFLDGMIEHGDYWKHVEQFCLLQSYYPNIHFVQYEEMKRDLKKVIQELASFLDKSLSNDLIERLYKHLQFDSMKYNQAVNKEHLTAVGKKNRPTTEFSFMRRGIFGAYEDEMSQEYIKKFDKLTEKRFKNIEICKKYINKNI